MKRSIENTAFPGSICKTRWTKYVAVGTCPNRRANLASFPYPRTSPGETTRELCGERPWKERNTRIIARKRVHPRDSYIYGDVFRVYAMQRLREYEGRLYSLRRESLHCYRSIEGTEARNWIYLHRESEARKISLFALFIVCYFEYRLLFVRHLRTVVYRSGTATNQK